MPHDPFVPADFEPPTSLATEYFRLERLGPQHNASDLAAWTLSIEHIRNTPGFPNGDWPPVGGMTRELNLADLTRHAADFTARTGFTFTVLEPDGAGVIGCVYIYPTQLQDFDVDVKTWVRADQARLDAPLAAAVAKWLTESWPWQRLHRHGR